ncbi:MAG: DEAD/DEAH box helicase [Actinobacteria bacterium]|nr:DEAD/DEAH box helicase [Actinomycetota bacterium]
MPSAARATGAVDVDDVGSHFVLTAAAGRAVATDLERLPHAAPADSGWVAPAIPLVAAALRSLLGRHPAVEVRPRAERLLSSVEKLPATATSVALLCEHRPGRPGVVIATTGDPLVNAALSDIPGRRHDATLGRWWIPAREEPLRALRDVMARVRGMTATQEVRRRLEGFEQPALDAAAVAGLEHRCNAQIIDAPAGEARLRICRRCNPDVEPALRARDIAVARSFDSWWLTIDGGGRVLSLLGERPELLAGRDLRVDLERATATARDVDAMDELSSAAVGPTTVGGVAALLRPFQGAAVQYAVRARRTFLADEPGLGKTLQALGSLEEADGFPALIVCPASLRLNWLRETAQWLPGRSVGVLDPDAAVLDDDVHVVSYDVLHRLSDALQRSPPRALVLDEAHFCKNPSARRTRAALAIAEALDAQSLVLLLTGTPVVNRPDDLVSQLRILNRLEEFGGRRRLAQAHRHAHELPLLHARLRRTCFVRRMKSDVLDQLPDKQRVVVPVNVTNRAEYRAVQSDVARWLREQAEADVSFLAELETLPAHERETAIRARGREAEQRARRAEALIRIGKLALVAARGKLEPGVEWIEAFLESGEKLVVFTRHREIGDRLLEAFPAAAVATGRIAADARAQEIARFQEDADCRLIVCSLDAAGVGITLTAASNVAFLEMGWTPATHDQAEDRVHRIGQQNAVTAWYILAADTIDERIAAVVERKRRLVRATSDGTVAADERALDDLLGWVVAQEGAPEPGHPCQR